ncbi:lipopolysaccharide heptosyltransferase II [Campylobacter pinnipediorum subsp. pinnipediorum]|uniref:lipopolysaccharide heptosyltransferase II n=1 Tax=Campylobacter pinnipediorum subsp. pinnipediorum TaxID=1660067 RepID=A0AAX0LBE7_9BACT|nr:lipopolysaccharide heptosyltransferase II [Campylobacter pinnipediorum]OPA81599.1 lipopolysaccharide heptosyltransferase II [Campylobacter pinnipediorum subsp. pinnipediorum]
MRIFIELPTWLGDCIMATPAIQSLIENFPNCKIVFFGSFVSTEILKSHKNCEFTIIDESKKHSFRWLYLFKICKKMDKFDLGISFRSSFASFMLLKFIKANKKIQFKKTKTSIHQAKKYLNFAKNALNLEKIKDDLYIPINKEVTKNFIGINPGATYGSAKKWYPEYFAEVAIKMNNGYEFLIFGSKNESKICDEIAEILQKNNINFKNLCGKTNIQELCKYISSLKLFITNDSGPMHIAANYKIPTIALFGPTKYNETSPFKNKNAHLLHLNLPCQPCMKRVCPIKTHECMKNLTSDMVIKKIKEIGF